MLGFVSMCQPQMATAKVFGHHTATDNHDLCYTPKEVLELVVTPETASTTELIKVWDDPKDIEGMKKGVIEVLGKNDPSLKIEDLDFNLAQIYKNSDIKGQVYVVLFNKPPKSDLNPEDLPNCMTTYFWEDETEYDQIIEKGLPDKASGFQGIMDLNVTEVHLGNIVENPKLKNAIATHPGSGTGSKPPMPKMMTCATPPIC